MSRKIFRSIFLVAEAVLIACMVLLAGVLYEYLSSIQRDQLKIETTLAAQGVENGAEGYFSGLDTAGFRVTWIASDGTVLYDSEADAATMENHRDREEIREALETGYGESVRYSNTLAENRLYCAQRLEDGTVVRVSVTQSSVFSLALGMVPYLLCMIVLTILLSAVLARRLSRRIVAPINKLNLDEPLENNTYEELAPLLTRMEQQRRQIMSQIKELKWKKDEFNAVIDSMSEGLILINTRGQILSINRAATRLFGTDASCVGRDILTVDRSFSVQELVSAAQSGKHGEIIKELKGRRYLIDASPVVSGDRAGGIVILAFDITEKALAEQQRREFSANVSHELKTPLQAITGSAELIENGLVKKEDLPRFIGHIRQEASRLVTLIDDIIRLSQLDEGGAMPQEDVDIKTLAEDVIESLGVKAAEAGVSLAVQGSGGRIHGVRRLLWEIVFNLCDNAIKYNIKNGSVDVTVNSDEESVQLTVSDTGIGIPPEHQARVFERFYRVDKSHSKATGGTGLGLSIVKHAVLYHGGSIDLQSTPGVGTTVDVRFPKDENAGE